MGAAAEEQVQPETWEQKLQRLGKRKPTDDWYTIHDPDAVQAVTDANQALTEAKQTARMRLTADFDRADIEGLEAAVAKDRKVRAAEKALTAAVEAAKDADVTFHFRALPPNVYDDIEFKNPPTEEQEKAGMRYNPQTLTPALLSACCVDDLPEETVRQWLEGGEDGTSPVTLGEIDGMVKMCHSLNRSGLSSLGKGLRPTSN
jgi:hypothetical protein